MNSRTISRLQILAAAVLFSTGGAGIKLCALSGWQVAGFRSGVAALAVLLMMPDARRHWGWRPLMVSIAYAAMLILFVSGNKLTTAANTIFLQSTAPLYVLLLSPWLLREPTTRRDLLFMAVLALGLATFFVGVHPSFTSAPDPGRGNVIAALSGVAYGVTIVGLRWLSRREDGSVGAAIVGGNLIAFLFCLPWALPVETGTTTDWLVIGYLGTFQIGLAYVCFRAGVRHVPAFEASLLLLLEPVLNPVWAWAVQGEHPGSWSLLGGGTILTAVVVKTSIDALRRACPERS